MDNRHKCSSCHRHGQQPGQRGPTSYWMQNPARVFREIGLQEGDAFLDLGCGLGEYTLDASRIVGSSGIVYALDVQRRLIADLQRKAKDEHLGNIKAMVSDITAALPIGDDSIDVCFIATVLHVPSVAKTRKTVLTEIRRVLKPNGRLAIIECKKHDSPYGPPAEMRLSPEEIEDIAAGCGFGKLAFVDFEYNYLIEFGSGEQ